MGWMMVGPMGWLLIVLFWTGLVATAVWVVSMIFPSTNRRGDRKDSGPSAQKILPRRYASGDLTRAQYETMLQDINSSSISGQAYKSGRLHGRKDNLFAVVGQMVFQIAMRLLQDIAVRQDARPRQH